MEGTRPEPEEAAQKPQAEENDTPRSDDSPGSGALLAGLAASAVLGPVAAAGVLAKPASEAARRSADAAANALDVLQNAWNKGVDTVAPECPVHAFMLPIGPDADDYLLVFDLDEFLVNLQTGVLARPSIDLWAATSDGHSVPHLAEEMATRFAEEFAVAMGQIVQEGEAAVSGAQSVESAAWEALGGESGKTVRNLATGAALYAVGAEFILGALGFGWKPRVSILRAIGDYRRARSNRATAEKDFKREVAELEREFRRKRKPFERAVGRLEIREHPGLQAAAAALRGEDAPPVDAPTISDDLPDVGRFLENPAYVEALSKARAAQREREAPQEPEASPSNERGGFLRRLFGRG